MKILFKCHCADGMPVFITGNHPALGEWDTNRALPMQLQNDGNGGGREWSAVLDLEPGRTIEYKFVKKGDHGHVQWESGWNRTYTAVAGIGSISDTFRT
jgi:alpha-amylase